MIQSMTGYGKAERKTDLGTVVVEIRTVNHRFLDFSIRLPRSLNGFEREIERSARRTFRRGHVYISIMIGKPGEPERYGINRDYLKRLYVSAMEFAETENIPGSADINTLLSLPDAVTSAAEDVDGRLVWPGVRKTIMEAIQVCARMRAEEGGELLRDMERRLAAIEKTVARIGKRAPLALKRALYRARKRLVQLLDGVGVDDNRWAAEAAILTDRTDFSEELVRLRSHIGQLGTTLRKGGEVSKKITFLLQEIHRETTTMGNKAADSAIIRDCLLIKEGVEKIREQVQNVE